MARLTQRERQAIVTALAMLGAGEWSADFEPGEDPFDDRDIENAKEKIAAGIKRPPAKRSQR